MKKPTGSAGSRAVESKPRLSDLEAAVTHWTPQGDFVEMEGDLWYQVSNHDRMPPFLMALATDSDVWMFISSNGGLTAGRGTPEGSLLPYETVDRLHDGHLHTGPLTLLRVDDPQGGSQLWQPFADAVPPDTVQRHLYKNTTGNRLLFEEIDTRLHMRIRVQWSSSRELGIVRQVSLFNQGAETRNVQVLDGLRNLMPYGAPLSLQQTSSTLVDAYKQTDLDPHTGLATYSLTSKILDRAEAGEVLRTNVVWCVGLPTFDVCLSSDAVEAFRRGHPVPRRPRLEGQRGCYLVSGQFDLAPQQQQDWSMVGDVGLGHSELAALRVRLMQNAETAQSVQRQLGEATRNLRSLVASADGLQLSAQRVTTEHHFANVLFNCMRGGVFVDNGRIPLRDLRDFLETRNRAVATRHTALLGSLPDSIEPHTLIEAAAASGDADLRRLCYEYLPLTFGRRHGDPSRPWNRFDIRVSDDDGGYALHYEGNWRDIFQNWEALSWSFPRYLPHLIAKFVNASTIDGFNPYRINREGIDWELIDPHDPWSHIGYWGDHQIIYLLKFLETAVRFDPRALADLWSQEIFSYADVPYRLNDYKAIVADPHNTITFDDARAEEVFERVDALGTDGRLLADEDGGIYRATLLEKLLVPALSKLSNLVVDGGIWMNTQRPEWNDANNALVGHGVSMVTLCYLRRYLAFLEQHADAAEGPVPVSQEVVTWMQQVTAVLERHQSAVMQGVDDTVRRQILDELGAAFETYRKTVYAQGFAGKQPVTPDAVHDLCRSALVVLDHAIEANRRDDGLYHSYNLLTFEDSKKSSAASIAHLDEMLEGQVAVLSSGVLQGDQVVQLVQTLYSSALYRADQDSFLLYPKNGLPGFMERNTVPADKADAVGLLRDLQLQGNTSLIVKDALGVLRFHADIENARDVDAILDDLARQPAWKAAVAADRQAVHAVFESVFHHKAFTGRSGTMYAFEGLGSIYWHMVAKLLLAVQENSQWARAAGATEEVIAALDAAYHRVRDGLGFTKSVATFGAIPTDPYSHTPHHAGAQQPGMTGQVKEEILTRLGELGVTVQGGRLGFQPWLLRADEFLESRGRYAYQAVNGEGHVLDVPAGALAFSFCQVPIVFEQSDTAWIRVIRTPKEMSSVSGNTLDIETSQEIFTRPGLIARIEVGVPAVVLYDSSDRTEA